MSAEHYERLRVLLRNEGWDPELAREDEGYGVGIEQPEGVHAPSNEVARRLIDLSRPQAAPPHEETR